MSFIWPPGLLALLLIPLGIFVARSIERSRARRIAAVGGLGLPSAGAPPSDRARRLAAVPGALFTLAFSVLAVALARPEATVPMPVVEGTVILVFDVSASMLATDVDPTRIDVAKAAAKDFVTHAPSGIVVGIVAFSDAGISVQVPTNDQLALGAAIERLTAAHGTSLGQGILAALTAIEKAESGTPPEYYSNRSPAPTTEVAPVPPGSHGSARIVVLSDGENNEEPDPLGAAQAAADGGVPIDAVGVGTEAGTTLDLDGFAVHTRLEADMLRAVADTTAGTYFTATDPTAIRSIYSDVGSLLLVRQREIEVTGLLGGLGVLLLLAGALASFAWRGRLL